MRQSPMAASEDDIKQWKLVANEGNQSAITAIGQHYLEIGELDQAKFWLLKGSEMGSITCMELLAESYHEKGEITEAIYWFEKADWPEHVLTLASLYVTAGRYEDAIALYKSEINNEYGEQEKALSLLQELLKSLGRDAEVAEIQIPFSPNVHYQKLSDQELFDQLMNYYIRMDDDGGFWSEETFDDGEVYVADEMLEKYELGEKWTLTEREILESNLRVLDEYYSDVLDNPVLDFITHTQRFKLNQNLDSE